MQSWSRFQLRSDLAIGGWSVLFFGLAACSGDSRLVLGNAPDGGLIEQDAAQFDPERDQTNRDASDSSLSITFRAGSSGLGDRIEFACGEDCVEAQVVVEGGTAPYQIRWADGATGATRNVCAGEGPYAVHATDSGNPNGEFGTPQLSADASLSVQSAPCPDAQGCRVVTMGQASSCGEDSFVELGATLRAGQRYEFRYDLTLIGVGSFGVYASESQCAGVGPELARIEYNELPALVSERSASTCQTPAQDTAMLFLDQSPKVWGGADFATITVCEGCPSEAE